MACKGETMALKEFEQPEIIDINDSLRLANCHLWYRKLYANVQATEYRTGYDLRIQKDTGRIEQGIYGLCTFVQNR